MIEVELLKNEINVSVEKQGPCGRGVPEGGLEKQVLAKKSDDDFDVEWQDNTSPLSTDDLEEGENNLYFTEERGREAVSGLYDDKGTAQLLVGAHEEEFNHSLIATALQSETDPIFSSWLLNTPPLYSETDPVFMAWNRSTGISITESQISDFKTYIQSSEKGANNGVATLDAGGKVPTSQLPSTLLIYKGVWNATTNTPTLLATDTTKKGFVYTVSVVGTQFGIEWKLGDWAIYNDSGVLEKSDNSDDVVSVNGQQGVVVLGKSDVGLGNVDNTSDLNKPISTSTQSALDLKWSLNGNTLGSKKTLGSIDNQDFGIITNNAERLTVLKDGKVGIGMTNPQATLHVKGTDTEIARFVRSDNDNNYLSFRNSGTGSFGMSFVTAIANLQLNGNTRLSINSSGVGVDTTSQVNSFGVNGPASIGPSYVNTPAPTNGMIIQGNVGIGTPSPLSKLNVSGTQVTQASLIDNEDLFMISKPANAPTESMRAVFGLQKWSASNYSRTQLNIGLRNENSEVNVMSLRSDGNVGIGKTEPSDKLVVSKGTGEVRFGGINGRTLSAYEDGSLGNFDFVAASTYFNSHFILASKKQIQMYNYAGNHPSYGRIYIRSDESLSFDVNNLNRLLINSDGKVGIGTTNPSGKLSIGSNAGEDVYLFRDNNDVGDTTDGQSLYIYRMASEGNSYIRIYNDQYGSNVFNSSGNMLFSAGDGSSVKFSNLGTSNLMLGGGTYVTGNPYFRQYGYISAIGESAYIDWKINDATDNFELSPSASGLGYFNVKMPSIFTVGNVGIGTTSPLEKLEVNGNIKVSGNMLKMTGITTATRDGLTAVAGDIIYNTTTNKHQGYDGTNWNDLY